MIEAITSYKEDIAGVRKRSQRSRGAHQKCWKGDSRRIQGFRITNASAICASLNSLDPFFPREAFVMDFGVRSAGIFRMPPRIETVAMGDVGMMRRLVMRSRFVVLRRLVVMMRRLTVMLCGSVVVFDSLFSLGHSSFPPAKTDYSQKLPPSAPVVESAVSIAPCGRRGVTRPFGSPHDTPVSDRVSPSVAEPIIVTSVLDRGRSRYSVEWDGDQWRRKAVSRR